MNASYIIKYYRSSHGKRDCLYQISFGNSQLQAFVGWSKLIYTQIDACGQIDGWELNCWNEEFWQHFDDLQPRGRRFNSLKAFRQSKIWNPKIREVDSPPATTKIKKKSKKQFDDFWCQKRNSIFQCTNQSSHKAFGYIVKKRTFFQNTKTPSPKHNCFDSFYVHKNRNKKIKHFIISYGSPLFHFVSWTMSLAILTRYPWKYCIRKNGAKTEIPSGNVVPWKSTNFLVSANNHKFMDQSNFRLWTLGSARWWKIFQNIIKHNKNK